ncbi:MAG: hypothetical protein GXO35_08025 [Gammaproteobacteria bacterium]|nr:hypothetical protein [Gammaproteobacteria bacterium]
MLTVDRIDRAKQEAVQNRIKGLPLAFDLVKLHRLSFYGPYKRPYQPHETIKPLNKALDKILSLLEEKPILYQLWSAKQRDWQRISENAEVYFLIEAIDKIVLDAQKQLFEEGLDKADPLMIKAIRWKLERLKRE